MDEGVYGHAKGRFYERDKVEYGPNAVRANPIKDQSLQQDIADVKNRINGYNVDTQNLRKNNQLGILKPYQD